MYLNFPKPGALLIAESRTGVSVNYDHNHIDNTDRENNNKLEPRSHDQQKSIPTLKEFWGPSLPILLPIVPITTTGNPWRLMHVCWMQELAQTPHVQPSTQCHELLRENTSCICPSSIFPFQLLRETNTNLPSSRLSPSSTLQIFWNVDLLNSNTSPLLTDWSPPASADHSGLQALHSLVSPLPPWVSSHTAFPSTSLFSAPICSPTDLRHGLSAAGIPLRSRGPSQL